MYSQNILMSISYPRSVDSRNGFTPERSSLIHASASAGVHCHGYIPVKSTNRRTSRSLAAIVGAFKKRAIWLGSPPIQHPVEHGPQGQDE